MPPRLSRAGLTRVRQVEVRDHRGQDRQEAIPGELSLTVKVDGREVVTLMTLGTDPEELALGYLRSQRLVERIEDIASVSVDWDRETAEVTTRPGHGIPDLDERLSRVTVASSGSRGTSFEATLERLRREKLPRAQVRQSTLYRLLEAVALQNRIYQLTGSVHCFCLSQGERVLTCAEDVGRHNAADIIAGRMWLQGVGGEDKILFTTGRLSSEMVMKTALMGIPVLISKSGATEMGLSLAKDVGMVVVGRATTREFLVFNGGDQVVFDAVPPPGPTT